MIPQTRHPGDARQLEISEPRAEHRETHLCCEALAPRRFSEGKARLDDRLASDVVQQMKADARTRFALDGHPGPQTGMLVVVAEDPRSEECLTLRAVFDSAKVPRHVGV